jgi:sigma-E factor negative regulatory protein RseB
VNPPLLGQQPLLQACQRFVLVLGAGALGAAICATAVLVAGTDGQRISPRTVGFGTVPVPPPRPLTGSEGAAVSLLRNAGAAAAALHYRGKKLFASWSEAGGQSVLADVEHVPGRGTWVRVTSAGAGAEHQPSQPERELAADLGAPDPAALAVLASEYTVATAASESYAGREATVVEVGHAGWPGPAGRFWIDSGTGILLRHELYDRAGRQVRVVAFLDLDVDPASAVPDTPMVTASLPGARRASEQADGQISPARLASLRTAGWAVPGALPGGLVLYRAREVTADGSTALQLTYSDGLFTASVFAQRGRLDTGHLPGFSPETVGGVRVYAHEGLYRQLVWPGGDTVYTLVTDSPDEAVARIVPVWPHGPQQGGLLSRVGRGIDRMGSWINPFE